MRLDKLLAHTGYGTRKDVRDLLKKNRVQVDGKQVKKGNIHIDTENQHVTVDDEVVYYEQYIYLMLHKPQDYVSATVDDRDKTVIDLVPAKYKHYHLAPVGRLDKDTEGLVLLTNDGMFNHIVTSPKNNIDKTYYAKITGEVLDKHIAEFNQGVILDDGYETKPADLKIISSGEQSEITLSISEGKFHQVKRMFRAIGMEVTYLKRLRIGNIILDDQLNIGDIRKLNENEMKYVASLIE